MIGHYLLSRNHSISPAPREYLPWGGEPVVVKVGVKFILAPGRPVSPSLGHLLSFPLPEGRPAPSPVGIGFC